MKRHILSLGNAARVLALLCFLLPWVTVSCSSLPGDNAQSRVVTLSQEDGSAAATGLQLATGRAVISIRSAIDKALPAPPGPRPAVLAAALLILLGLAAAFVLAGWKAALAGLGASAAAIGLLVYSVFFEVRLLARDWLVPWARAEFPDHLSSLDPPKLLETIQVRPQIGFWLTIAALAAAIALDIVALKPAPRRPAPARSLPMPPASAPPPR